MLEAKKILGCSRTIIYTWVSNGELIGKWELVHKRRILLLNRLSVEALAIEKAKSRRVGRKLRRPNKRVRIKSKGYVLIWNPEHHRAFNDGYVPEHVLVAEQMLGRRLTKDEVVHHRNRVKDDNRPENLIVYASQSEHMKLIHAAELGEKIKAFNRD